MTTPAGRPGAVPGNAPYAAIATPHPEAARAGADILRSGGNAVDAAVAAILALCVVQPSQVGLGGYGGSLVARMANDRQLDAIDFDSRCPLAFRDEMLSVDPRVWTDGYLAVTVPGVVAGLDEALRTLGTRSWADVSAHAIHLAEAGVVVDEPMRRHIADKLLARIDDVSRRAAFPSGDAPPVGERWVQRDLARTLRAITRDGAASFYRGEVADRIVRQVRAHGGILSTDDFANFAATRVDPIQIDYRGRRIATPPPPSGGITTLQILKTLEQFDVPRLPRWGDGYLHLMAEAAKLCWQDRARALGDPDFIKIPIAELLSADTARRNAARIDDGLADAAPSVSDGGPHTVNVSAVDRAGNVVSITATQGWLFGAGVCIEGTGLFMGHGMSRFDPVPGAPNAPAPGKRMHHNMSPVIVLDADGTPTAAAGMAGGPKIVTVTAQLLSSLIDFGASAAEAIAAPRVHTEGGEPIAVSRTTPPDVVAALERRGHTVRLGQDIGGPPDQIGGTVNIIAIGSDGRPSAASSAGRDAVAIV